MSSERWWMKSVVKYLKDLTNGLSLPIDGTSLAGSQNYNRCMILQQSQLSKSLKLAVLATRSTSKKLARGFTLIEAMVTVSILVIIVGIAIPNLQDFIRRNTLSSLANGFNAGITQARSEAITRNSCVSICQSTTTQNSISGGAVSCVTSGDNWMRGWVIVTNPSCDSGDDNPVALTDATIIKVTQPLSDEYKLLLASGTVSRRIMFDSRGLISGLTAAKTFTLTPNDSSLGDIYRRRICISSSGRVMTQQYSGGGC